MKPALVIKAEDTPKEYKDTLGNTKLNLVRLTEEFWSCDTHIADRATCETNPSLQQIIPYIILVNEDSKLFCYSRGKGGEEERLHAKLSIGLGGHVDNSIPEGLTLKSWLTLEGNRELFEEVGFMSLPSSPMDFCALLSDQTDKVGTVHLGVLAIQNADTRELTLLEKGVIEHVEWLSIRELKQEPHHSRLENWSLLALQYLENILVEGVKNSPIQTETLNLQGLSEASKENSFELDIGFIEGLEKGVLANLALNLSKTSNFVVFEKNHVDAVNSINYLDLTFISDSEGVVYNELLVLAKVEKFNFSLSGLNSKGKTSHKFEFVDANIDSIVSSEFNSIGGSPCTFEVSVSYSLKNN
jgi:predicted NUDIX family phosphoesterase